MTRPTVSAPSDKRYVRSEFIELSELCAAKGADLRAVRNEIITGSRPHPTYTLDDGAEFVASDYLALETDRALFEARLRAKADDLGVPLHDIATIWGGYLSGAFGICLRHVSPETIVEKEYHIARITELTRENPPLGKQAADDLQHHVDALDAIERPFCDYDRAISEGRVSRDTFITAIRERYDLTSRIGSAPST